MGLFLGGPILTSQPNVLPIKAAFETQQTMYEGRWRGTVTGADPFADTS